MSPPAKHVKFPSAPRRFKTEDEIPQSGIYRVIHAEHRLPHEVTLLQGEKFPRCAKCNSAVEFQTVYAAPDAFEDRRGKIVLHAIPELDRAA